jgi:hypothetical protein
MGVQGAKPPAGVRGVPEKPLFPLWPPEAAREEKGSLWMPQNPSFTFMRRSYRLERHQPLLKGNTLLSCDIT